MLSPNIQGYRTVFFYIPQNSNTAAWKKAEAIAKSGFMKATETHIPDKDTGIPRIPRVNFTEVSPNEDITKIEAATFYNVDALRKGYCLVVRIPTNELSETNIPRNFAVYPKNGDGKIDVIVDKILNMKKQYENGYKIPKNKISILT